jgi:hypothetical protein
MMFAGYQELPTYAGCEIDDHTWVAPPKPADCPLAWGKRIGFVQGKPPVFSCHGDTLHDPNAVTLDYGDTHTVNQITCDSEPSGVTCTDASTGHFFRMSHDSYELG